MDKSTPWQLAQQEEWNCWKGLKEKLSSIVYFQEKSHYWNALLAKVQLSKEDLVNGKTLEVGCGPSGLFMLLQEIEKKDNYFVLDPLLDGYRTLVPEYLKGVQGYSSSLEELDPVEVNAFQSIFVINCIDHCRNMETFCEKLTQICSKEGRIYLAVNTHQRDLTARLWRRFQKILEPLHPYHYTQNEYAGFLSRYFEIEEILDIENEVIEVNRKTAKIADACRQPQKVFMKRLKVKLKGFLNKMHPSKMFFWILEKAGLPAHDFKEVGNSIYRHKMFVMKSRAKSF